MGPILKKAKFDNGTPIETNGVASEKQKHFPNPAIYPATDDEKKKWNGFVERESEPAFLNSMLRSMSVRGVKLQELFCLEREHLDSLHAPVHGLLFLYRYRVSDDFEVEPACPKNVWFANQVQDNLCCTVSLLNILLNIRSVDNGEYLTKLKALTETMDPHTRGVAVASSSFIRGHHNSQARKMQMLVDDMSQVRKSVSPPRNKGQAAKQTAGRKRKAPTTEVEDENAAFHYAAYVPIDGCIWRLDGLESQPAKVGTYEPNEDWLDRVAPIIEACCDRGQNFGLMAVVGDPILEQRANLAANVKTLLAIEARLDAIDAAWDEPAGRSEAEQEDHELALRGPSEDFGLAEEDLSSAVVPGAQRERLETAGLQEALGLQQGVAREQAGLRSLIKSSLLEQEDEEAKRLEQSHDFSYLIHTWLGFLATKPGVIRDLIEETS